MKEIVSIFETDFEFGWKSLSENEINLRRQLQNKISFFPSLGVNSTFCRNLGSEGVGSVKIAR